MKKKATLQSVSESIVFIVEHMATKDDVAELGRRVSSLEKGQGEILDILKPLSKAHDKDSVTIVDHGKRIIRLEKHVGV